MLQFLFAAIRSYLTAESRRELNIKILALRKTGFKTNKWPLNIISIACTYLWAYKLDLCLKGYFQIK